MFTEFILSLNQYLLFVPSVALTILLILITILTKDKISLPNIAMGIVITALILSFVGSYSAHREIKQYSETKLTNLSFDGFNLSIYKPDRIKQVGLVQVTVGNPWSKLGNLDCKGKSIKACIDEISEHQEEVVAQLQAQQNVVSK